MQKIIMAWIVFGLGFAFVVIYLLYVSPPVVSIDVDGSAGMKLRLQANYRVESIDSIAVYEDRATRVLVWKLGRNRYSRESVNLVYPSFPDDWRQSFPKTGKPLPLKVGEKYRVYVSFRFNHLTAPSGETRSTGFVVK